MQHNLMMNRDPLSYDVLFQEEECQDNYVKKCFIEYAKTAENVTVSVCRTPLVKDCNVEGEEVRGVEAVVVGS